MGARFLLKIFISETGADSLITRADDHLEASSTAVADIQAHESFGRVSLRQ
jgi:hypothetical protein